MGTNPKGFLQHCMRGCTNSGPGSLGVLEIVVVCGYSIWLLYQDGKEKNNSLCSFVPGGDTAVPCWEIWALAC